MEADQKPRIKIHFTLLMVIVCVSTIVMSTFSVLSVRRNAIQGEYVQEVYDGLAYIQQAQLDFEKMKSYPKNVFIYSGEIEELERSKSTVYELRGIILLNLESYIAAIEMSLPYSDRDIIMHLRSLIEEYFTYSAEMFEKGMTNDTAAAKEIMESLSPLGMEISDRFSELSMRNKEMSFMVNERSAEYTNQAILTIVILSVFVIILFLIASIIIARKISESISNNSDETRYANSPPVDVADKNGAVLVSELERCVSDLKAVTYDLSRTAKEIRR